MTINRVPRILSIPVYSWLWQCPLVLVLVVPLSYRGGGILLVGIIPGMYLLACTFHVGLVWGYARRSR
ncbi:hypothetical protein F4801DRAFT_18232 [Xylaria longipes]|nr:hypothetical protein F4801DRAFT_18232 [Xylaria longipes]